MKRARTMSEGGTRLMDHQQRQQTVTVTMGLLARGFAQGTAAAAVALIGMLALLQVAGGGDALSGWWLIVTGLLVAVGALLGGLLGIAYAIGGHTIFFTLPRDRARLSGDTTTGGER